MQRNRISLIMLAMALCCLFSFALAEEPYYPMAGFTAQDLDGNSLDEGIFEGYDLTMVNIWGTYCGPCRGELAALGALSREYGDQGLQVLGLVIDTVDAQGNPDSAMVDIARSLVEEADASYVHLQASQSLAASLLWQVQYIPTTIFLDRDGALLDVCVGALDHDAWEQLIQQQLASVNAA